ncbi:uncharacterized protein LOC124409668 [Diprion similis]|uniref:uncharacterized protein LOC124409668 n=1 Tax=Diprion similis TaxID=362088 RepID=UPI001EF958FD|nr:uncharacterized protein LOC124409668 [Diprion similis]
MKRTQNKRSGSGLPRGVSLKKPFDFCCDVKNQDLDTRYDRRQPPFKSSLENIFLNGGGPDLKLRIQDIGKPPYPIRREGRKTLIGAPMGECNRCRGPLKWYLEDEISLARDLLAHDRQTKYNADANKHVKIALEKARRKKKLMKKQRQKKVN